MIPFPFELLKFIYNDQIPAVQTRPCIHAVSRYSISALSLYNKPSAGIHSHSPFSCCGAGTLHGLNFTFSSEQEKQDFLTCWMHHKPIYLTYYFIAASNQIPTNDPINSRRMLFFLIHELGAREIDAQPNRLHDPHLMHMYTLCLHPEVNPKVLNFVKFTSSRKVSTSWNPQPDTRSVVPQWWWIMKETDQHTFIKDNKEAIEKEKGEMLARIELRNQNESLQRRNEMYSHFVNYPEDALSSLYLFKNHIMTELRRGINPFANPYGNLKQKPLFDLISSPSEKETENTPSLVNIIPSWEKL